MAMDVDDVEALEMFGEGPIGSDNKLADADFFNTFQNDFRDVQRGSNLCLVAGFLPHLLFNVHYLLME
ncbi:hypothetical protein Vadar_030484 [Vaccinium darrowii]|uniref:Uncharacterized protein n=1 Tax=Vaccinium darrowii TaxID=229202 RepID=A0ACB7X592_9ERIC|nr:hypothetical protein Vadar_030484 [Vaccinium darrowii]